MLLSPALTLLIVAGLAGGSSAARTTRPRIVALGDSLTAGYGIGEGRAFPAVLQGELHRSGYPLQIVNAGVSGDTSGRAVARFRATLNDEVGVLIVALGANDGLRGLPVADLRRNLSTIITEAQARGIAVLLCGMEALPVHGWNYSVEFHQVYVDLARQFDLPLVPFMMLRVLGNASLMQADHVHPNAAGAREMAAHVWPYLDALLTKSGYSRSAT